jgi:biotin operon repressor
MNRADRMLSVLKDGRVYSRREIFERVGYLMTNNAAAELRARGFEVEHRKEKGNDVYRLVGRLDEARATNSQSAAPTLSAQARASSSTPSSNPSPLPEGDDHRSTLGRDGEGVLTLFEVAA